jgi:hypothetical protein
MTKILCTLLFSLLFNFSFSQNVEYFQTLLNDIISEVPAQIHIANKCDELINRIRTIYDDLEDIIKNTEEVSSDKIKSFGWMMAHAKALQNFLLTVGNSSNSGSLPESQFKLVQELFRVSLTEIYNQKFCCKLFEVKMHEYKCVLAFIKGDKLIYRIKAKISSKSGSRMANLDMGLESNEYNKLWSNGDDLSLKLYKIISINCSLPKSYHF